MSRRILLACIVIGLCMSPVHAHQEEAAPAPPPPAPNPASAPAPATPKAPPITLYMPDGQLASHGVRIYVTHDIPSTAKPRLQLFGDHAVTRRSSAEDGLWEPKLVAPGQKWTQPGPDGQGPEIGADGTLLLFDLKSLDFDGKAMRRLMPVVVWVEGETPRLVVGTREVNVGNTVWTGAWTSAVVGLSLLLVIALSWQRASWTNPVKLLTGVDGHLSLAQTQIACWTIAVGSIVLAYGFVRLRIPEIPETLLALMGASLATGGVAFFRDAQKQQAAAGPGQPIPQASWHITDLLKVFTPGAGQAAGELSLAKAQMLFWTVLLIVLFVVKSVLEGAIWNVPWQLVALLGFSQAGYLAPKMTQ